MKKNTWTWSITSDGGEYKVTLAKHTLWTEILSALGGELIRHGVTYRLGNRLIFWLDGREEVITSVPVDAQTALRLGWDL